MFFGRGVGFAASEFNFAIPPRNDEGDIQFSGDALRPSFYGGQFKRRKDNCDREEPVSRLFTKRNLFFLFLIIFLK